MEEMLMDTLEALAVNIPRIISRGPASCARSSPPAAAWAERRREVTPEVVP
jgi:hypothetical protein